MQSSREASVAVSLNSAKDRIFGPHAEQAEDLKSPRDPDVEGSPFSDHILSERGSLISNENRLTG